MSTHAIHRDLIFDCRECEWVGIELVFDINNEHGRCPRCSAGRDRMAQYRIESLMSAARRVGVLRREVSRMQKACRLHKLTAKASEMERRETDAMNVDLAFDKKTLSMDNDGHLRNIQDLRNENARLRALLAKELRSRAASKGQSS